MAEISYFECNDRIYNLKSEIPLTISEDDGYSYAENEDFDLNGIGFSENEAVEDARLELGMRYEWKFEKELPIPKDIPEWIEKVDGCL